MHDRARRAKPGCACVFAVAHTAEDGHAVLQQTGEHLDGGPGRFVYVLRQMDEAASKAAPPMQQSFCA
jgi:hypothetical protein